jgi:hypothetical protein
MSVPRPGFKSAREMEVKPPRATSLNGLSGTMEGTKETDDRFSVVALGFHSVGDAGVRCQLSYCLIGRTPYNDSLRNWRKI